MASDSNHGVVADILSMEGARAFVAGDLLLDEYVDGRVGRISPEAPVPVVLEHGHRSVLGGAANVAAGIRSLGVETAVVGRVGHDREGRVLEQLCSDHEVSTRWLVRSPTAVTVRKTRVLAGWQQLMRLDREDLQPSEPEEEDQAVAALEAFLAEGGRRCVVLSDYGKGFLTATLTRRLIETAAGAGVPVVVDPKSTDLARYRGCTVLKPNLAEALAACGRTPPAPDAFDVEEAASLAKAVLVESSAANVVLSLASHGVLVHGNDIAEPSHFDSAALQVADVSGAGDTMVAVLAAGLAAGLPLLRVVDLANVAAGAVCARAGTTVLSASELVDAFNAATEGTRPEKVLADRNDAARLAELHRRNGRRVVFTNGCFDILHAGHVRLLQAARAEGDVLLVGLNSDDSVRRLKGPDRPAQHEDDRAAILAGLAAVDGVVAFDEDTPKELIEAIRPDVIVKGGDYSPEDVVGAAEVASWGGRVHIVPLLEGRSTTRLLSERGSGQPPG